ncbi:hypothetical protein Tco_1111973 [Tanacetum coccineum]|uniref:Uncharacterized protein n=1 Tax=Tanacetum coccineum TaxID=301880 RepID=A0ABQ5IN59_9ASTR
MKTSRNKKDNNAIAFSLPSRLSRTIAANTKTKNCGKTYGMPLKIATSEKKGPKARLQKSIQIENVTNEETRPSDTFMPKLNNIVSGNIASIENTRISEMTLEEAIGICIKIYEERIKYKKANNYLEHDENDHGLIEKVISLCDPNCDVGMLWQFKSHHSHLKSELIDDYFAENCNFSMEEGGHSEEPERMVSNIAIKALDHARECRERRYHLLKENFKLTLRDAKVYTFHMNHIVAARVWSISFEEFILAPNCSFICYLDSIQQEATVLDLNGDKQMAMSALQWGKDLSLQRGPSFYLGRRIYRKTQDINAAKKELRLPEELRGCVSCKKCQLMLKHEISKESTKQKRKNGKDYVFKDETSKVHEVFLENICLLVSLSSLPSRKSPRMLSMLLNLAKQTEIKVVHGTHVAERIYIISWVACMKGKSACDFSIPNETLINTLKHALILSSETPELYKKVAQLLAIMYFPGYFNEPPFLISANSLTQCHWACFFHELAVGSGVDYLFSQRLSKLYGDDSDPHDNLHMLTTSSVVDLNEFVSKFYAQLQPHTILVINILGDKYKKLLSKFPFYVPSEHAAFLMISRFSSTHVPLFDIFQVNSKGSGRLEEPWKVP